jgi:hypothetical protein
VSAIAWAVEVAWLLGDVVTARWVSEAVLDHKTSFWPLEFRVTIALLSILMVAFWQVTWCCSCLQEGL